MALNLIKRLTFFLVLLGTISAIYQLDKNRGGDIDRRNACILSDSRVKNGYDSVILFGSSRSNTAFDPFYINSILKKEEGLAEESFARYGLLGRDGVSPYFLLKNRIENGRAPKIVIMELMLGSANVAARDKKIKPRRNAMLDYEQQITLIEKFKRSTQSHWILDRLVAYIDRTTALAYGLIKHPSPRFWNPDSCGNMNPRGHKKVSRINFSEAGTSSEEIQKATEILEAGYDQAFKKMTAPKSKWSKKMRQKERQNKKRNKNKISSASPIYSIDKPFAQREVKDLQLLVRLAEKHGSKVIILPMLNYHEVLESKEIELIQSLFPNAEIYNIFEDARPTINAYLHDLHHTNKKGAMLMSALLTRKIVDKLQNDQNAR